MNTNRRDNRPEVKEPNRTLQAAVGLGYQLLAAMLIFAGAGYYLDWKSGGGVLYTLLGIGLALLYGGYEVWKLVRALNEDAEREQRERPPRA